MLEPSLADLIREAQESRLADVFTAMIGTVVTFSPGAAGQAATVDVQPEHNRTLPVDDEGTTEPEPLPMVPGVPVVYPTGGGMRITWPLAPGDAVLLVVLTTTAAGWRSGSPLPYGDVGLHHPGNCFAIAGVVPDIAWTGPVDATALVLESAAIKLGSTAAVDPVANATKVDIELAKIAASLASISPPPGTPYTPTATGFVKVKAE